MIGNNCGIATSTRRSVLTFSVNESSVTGLKLIIIDSSVSGELEILSGSDESLLNNIITYIHFEFNTVFLGFDP